MDLECHRILKPRIAAPGGGRERPDRARPELCREVAVERSAVDGLVVEEHHEVVISRVVNCSVSESSLAEGLCTRIGEREPDAPLLGVGIFLRHTDAGDLVPEEDMFGLVPGRLDPDFEHTLLADDLLRGRHIHTGKFYPGILRVLAPCRGEQVDLCILHAEGVYLLAEDPFHVIGGVPGYALVVGDDLRARFRKYRFEISPGDVLPNLKVVCIDLDDISLQTSLEVLYEVLDRFIGGIPHNHSLKLHLQP